MNTLNTLHDAFTTLEERADAVHATPPDFTVSFSPARSGLSRFAAPAAAAAAVVTVAAGVTVWQSAQHSGHGGAPAPQSAAHGPSAPSSHPARPRSNRYQPPSTVAELQAKATAILSGAATITIDPTRSGGCNDTAAVPPSKVVVRNSNGALSTSTPTTPVQGSGGDGCSGSALVGTLTSNGHTGGFDLDVFAATPGTKATCDADTGCQVRPYRGGSVATGSWQDPNTPGGVTYQVEYVRSDGAEVLAHLSTLADPKGESHVIASTLPLTTQQLISFVTSAEW